MKTSKSQKAFTLLELLVVISIIAIMASLALPHILSALVKGEMLQTLSNERQLYLATQAMALDASTMASSEGSWPGDFPVPSFSAWATALCQGGYLSTNDFCKLCAAPGVTIPSGKIPTAQESAFIVYPVHEESDSNAIFLITRNATIQGSGTNITITLNPSIKPYGNKGCVIIHRGGDAVYLMKNQLTNSSLIGSLATNAAVPLN